jgi:hypothetical protein
LTWYFLFYTVLVELMRLQQGKKMSGTNFPGKELSRNNTGTEGANLLLISFVVWWFNGCNSQHRHDFLASIAIC